MEEYNTECPLCGGSIDLVGCTVDCRVPVSEDGWALADGGYLDTSDEVFACHANCLRRDCTTVVPSSWVFDRMTQEEAKKWMEDNA